MMMMVSDDGDIYEEKKMMTLIAMVTEAKAIAIKIIVRK